MRRWSELNRSEKEDVQAKVSMGFAFAIVFILLGLLYMGCRSCVRSLGEAEQRQKALVKQSGFETSEGVYIESVGEIRVIHDTKREVTCWHANSGMGCVPDKDVRKQ